MTLIELLVFLALISLGIVCGKYAQALWRAPFGLICGILSVVLAIAVMELVGKLTYFIHRRKMSRVLVCRCGECGPDDYTWSYDKELDKPTIEFECGRKYYLLKGELREIGEGKEDS